MRERAGYVNDSFIHKANGNGSVCMFLNVMGGKIPDPQLPPQMMFHLVGSSFNLLEKSLIWFLTSRAAFPACHHLPDIGSLFPISLPSIKSQKVSRLPTAILSPVYHTAVTCTE